MTEKHAVVAGMQPEILIRARRRRWYRCTSTPRPPSPAAAWRLLLANDRGQDRRVDNDQPDELAIQSGGVEIVRNGVGAEIAGGDDVRKRTIRSAAVIECLVVRDLPNHAR